MERITQLKEKIAQYLRAWCEGEQMNIMTAYPGKARRDPLPCPTVVVGIDSVEAQRPGLGSYLGHRDEGPLHGGTALITVRFDLYAPAGQGGDALHGLYEMLCDALILARSPFGVEKVNAGPLEADDPFAPSHMTACAALRTALVYSDTSVAIESFRVVRTGDKPPAAADNQTAKECI